MGLFFELLQVALGTGEMLSRAPSLLEWESLLAEAQRQAVVGVLASGLERLPAEQRPPKPVLLQWIGRVQMIETLNHKTTEVCRRVCAEMEQDGFRVCVLKGQANHAYYPDGMGARRHCGDVDVWVQPVSGSGSRQKDIRRILAYVEEKFGLTGLCWLHASSEVDGITVEEHFHPSFMNAPFRNLWFQRWFADMSSCIERKMVDGMEIPALKVERDVVYQMNHIYRHLIDEGVGLRQVVDFFWTLRAFDEVGCSREDAMLAIRRFGMRRFAAALMWVLGEICGMRPDQMLCAPSEMDGRFLLNEISLAGNFGHFDERLSSVSGRGFYRQLSQAWRRFKRNLRFVTSYPEEVLWEPCARVWHFGWKVFCGKGFRTRGSFVARKKV